LQLLVEAPVFQPKAFRKELSAILRTLCSDLDVAEAVRRVRAQRVPDGHQTQQFVDLLTRACEVPNAVARKATFSLAAALADDGFGAFVPALCLKGVGVFFREVYPDLCREVPRLPSIIKTEFVPMMRVVVSAQSLESLLPKGLVC